MAFQGGFPPREIDTTSFESHGTSQLAAWLDEVKVSSEATTVTIDFPQGQALAEDSQLDQWFLASLELQKMRHLHQFKEFDLADSIHRRVTDRLPTDPDNWVRRAHQLSFNTSMEFDGSEARYQWVRRGINVLLDGAAKNQESFDLLYMTAMFVGLKIDGIYTPPSYQELFSRDEELHNRLANYIDLEATRAPDGQVNSWLVAEALFKHCIAMYVDEGMPTKKLEFILLSRPARAHAGYAESMDEKGEFELAAREWAIAKDLYQEFGEEYMFGMGGVRFNHIEEDSADLEDKSKQRVNELVPFFQGWLWRAEFEQTKTGRSIRKLEFDAMKLATDEKLDEAGKKFHAAMMMIAAEYESNSPCGDECFRAYMNVIESYLDISKKTDTKDQTLNEFIQTYQTLKANTFFHYWY